MRKTFVIPFFTVLLLQQCIHASAQNAAADSLQIQQLPSIPFLPDPLILDEGGKNIPVKTRAQWQQKKNWIKEQYQHWIAGSIPPSPKNIRATILHETMEGTVKLRTVELRFGPEEKAKMTVELIIPPSHKPLPVFMTQWNHRGWAQVAVKRGYIGCVYAGADSKDDTENYSAIYPGYDFATLMKRAWGASRVIDYLYQLKEIDTSRIALVGHSRNGKQSLMAAAFDERIKAVISSSGGTGGENTFRWSDYRFTPGSFDRMVANKPDWFSARLPAFIGLEQKLPVDQNSLMSLVAPRGLMMMSAITEDEGNPWGIGESYKSVKQVYSFLQADSNLAILLRPGRHQHAARDAEDFVDFFDYVFGRSRIRPENKRYYNYSFDAWKKQSGEKINPLQFPLASKTAAKVSGKKQLLAAKDSITQKIGWLLGEEPPGVLEKRAISASLTKNRTYPNDYLEEVIGQPSLPDSIKKMTIGPYFGLGEDLWGNIYFPAGAVVKDSVVKKLPLVIYLHEYTYATGYHRKSASIISKFTDKGYAVLAADLVGFGTRIEEALHFYDRYPRWSLMGKMVADTRNIISDVCNRMPFVDTSNIYVVGYSLGGTVGLLTAALDNRVKGTAVISGFSSLRNNIAGTEGIRHFSHLHGLLPRLGFFVNHENRIPVDFDEMLTCVAPRPIMVIAPTKDRNYTSASVSKIVSALSSTYQFLQASENIRFEQPNTHVHFSDEQQNLVADWLQQQKTKP